MGVGQRLPCLPLSMGLGRGLMEAEAVVPPSPPSNVFETGRDSLYPRRGRRPLHPAGGGSAVWRGRRWSGGAQEPRPGPPWRAVYVLQNQDLDEIARLSHELSPSRKKLNDSVSQWMGVEMATRSIRPIATCEATVDPKVPATHRQQLAQLRIGLGSTVSKGVIPDAIVVVPSKCGLAY